IIEGQKIVIWFRITVAPCLVDEQEHAPSKNVVVGADEATLTGCDVLTLLQAEGAYRAHGSNQLSIVFGEKSLCAILDHGNIARVCKFVDLVHLARITKQVGNDDCLGTLT